MKAAKWCRELVERIVPRSRVRVVVFCSLLALASMRCISDFVLTPDGGAPPPLWQLRFVAAPGAGAPGTALEPRIRVAVVDEDGRRVDSVAVTITLGIAEGPPGVSLGGTTTAAATRGEAVFDSVAVDGPGDVRLGAFAAGLAPDTTGPVVVAWPPVDEIVLSPRDVNADRLGDTIRVTYVLRDEDGRELPGVPLTWSSSDPSVATVERGVVVIRGNGEAVIRAEVQGVAETVDVEVRQRVRRVIVTPSELVLPLYSAATVTAVALDGNDSAVTRPFRFSWRSSRSSRVAVYPGGGTAAEASLRRFRSGSTTVSATLEGVTGSVTVR